MLYNKSKCDKKIIKIILLEYKDNILILFESKNEYDKKKLLEKRIKQFKIHEKEDIHKNNGS